jgi:hyperosmotically inducible periplasmic protein
MRVQTAIVAVALLAAAGLGGCVSTATESNDQAVADSTITANVKAALVQDPATRASNIMVNTLDGTVELTGFVNTRGQRHEAVDVARNVAGVRDVRDELQVSGPGEVVGAADSDANISRRVEAALQSDPDTESAAIKVSTSDGVVQLAGFVNSNQQRDAAGDTASSVRGVRHVDNDLRLSTDAGD